MIYPIPLIESLKSQAKATIRDLSALPGFPVKALIDLSGAVDCCDRAIKTVEKMSPPLRPCPKHSEVS